MLADIQMEGCLWSHYMIYPCRTLIIVMEQAINRIKEDFECLSFFKKLWSDLVGEYTHVYFIARLIFQHPSRQISSQHIVSQVPNILYKSKLGSIGWNLMQARKLLVYNINKKIEKLKIIISQSEFLTNIVVPSLLQNLLELYQSTCWSLNPWN